MENFPLLRSISLVVKYGTRRPLDNKKIINRKCGTDQQLVKKLFRNCVNNFFGVCKDITSQFPYKCVSQYHPTHANHSYSINACNRISRLMGSNITGTVLYRENDSIKSFRNSTLSRVLVTPLSLGLALMSGSWSSLSKELVPRL